MEGLRPLGVGEILDAGIRIYRQRWRNLVIATAIVTFPVLVFSTLVTWSATPDNTFTFDPTTAEPTFDLGDAFLSLAGTLVAALATFVATSLATAACFRAMSGAYVGDDADWRESIRFALSRVWSVLGLAMLTTLAMIAGLLACVVGVVWPIGFFAVATPVLLMEGTTATDALGRSRQLVSGMFWRVLGIVLLMSLLGGIVQGAISAPAVALIFTDPGSVTLAVVNAVTTFVATVVVTPFSAGVTLALYVDLRVRKEGFDLALWAQRLGAQPPPGGFPHQPGAPVYVQPQYPGYPPQYPGYPPQQYPGYPPPPPPPPPPYDGGGSGT